MSEKEAVAVVVKTIKTRKPEVVSFIVSHGGVVKKTDSDVKIGQELVKVLSRNKKAQDEFTNLLGGDQFIGAAIGGLTSILGGSSQAKISEQQGSDAITLALINAGIQKDKETNWPLMIGLGMLAVIVIVIGILLYQKYKRK